MSTPYDVAGFQFNVSGAQLTGASGGLAADAGFTVSTGGELVVLGFSFSGDVIPAGSSGVLTTLSINGTTANESCLSEGVFSDSNGDSIEYLFGDCH